MNIGREVRKSRESAKVRGLFHFKATNACQMCSLKIYGEITSSAICYKTFIRTANSLALSVIISDPNYNIQLNSV